MREFTATLQKIMSVVSNQLELLPASEGAVEEMTFVGEEERDDTKLSGENLLVETSLEVPKPTWKYRALRPIYREENHFFRYFLDGSYRHYFLATGLEHDRATPIFLAQIAIVILRRNRDGKLNVVTDFKFHQWYLLLAKARVSGDAWNRIIESTQQASVNIKVEDISEADELNGDYQDTQDLRQRGQTKTRYLMGIREIEIARHFREVIPDAWLIKDGVISIGAGRRGIQTPKLIGVAKNFTTVQKFFTHDGKSRTNESVASLLGSLPLHHRTPVFEGYGGNTGFWYVRLRASQQVLYPLYGVVKIEIPALEQQPLTTDLMDEISGAIVGERFVTPYGSDDRWHSHLYPIYQAEHASKQCFYSTEAIQGCINAALRSQRQ